MRQEMLINKGHEVPKVYMQWCSTTEENYSKLDTHPEKPQSIY